MSTTVQENEVLESAARRGILDAVKQSPGVTLTDLAHRLGFRPSSIIWHTTKLGKAGLVRTDRVAGHRLFYASEGGIHTRRMAIASYALRQPCTRWLYGVLLRHPGVSLSRLAALASMRLGRAQWHLARLAAANLAIQLHTSQGVTIHPLPAEPAPAPSGPYEASRGVPVG